MSVPAAFDYHVAHSVDEAIALMSQYGDDAKFLAGGHSLLPTMKLRLAQPGHLIDLGRIHGLSYVHDDANHIAIGAMTTYATLEKSSVVHQNFPLFTDGIPLIGDQQVRNRGTIGGSVAHSDPAADMPGMVLALKANIHVKGPNGGRTIHADNFFQDLFQTSLEPGEVVTELTFAKRAAHSGSAYEKLANKASHYAVVGCAAVITLDAGGLCTAASVVITGASVKPSRAGAVEVALVGNHLGEVHIEAAASHAADGLEIVSDIHGSQAYRAQMAAVMAKRAITRAVHRAHGG
ncbi:MAG TPA: xanthine dehydrogenase family protein subunit M [Ktedonobacteraceae bacterium]|nr:xanthine dehydrogenase family protein subunit M [Ktedonobacteraceae bacterium]